MKLSFEIILLMSLAAIVVQDFRDRLISAWILPVILISVAGFRLGELTWKQMIFDASFNLIFIIVQFACLFFYYRIKNGRFENLFDTQIGWGDLLFLIAVCPAFSPIEFILFYLTSLLTALLIGVYSTGRSKKGKVGIPLAGVLSFVFLVLVLVGFASPSMRVSINDHLIAIFS